MDDFVRPPKPPDLVTPGKLPGDEISILLSQPRRLTTPTREAVHEMFRANEKRSLLWIALELLVILGGLGWWLLQPEKIPQWQSALLFGVGFLGLFDFLVDQFFANRKKLQDLRSDVKFGMHTRDSLVAALKRVKDRLGLGEKNVQVYLARDKDVNAYALRMELLPGLRLFNAVQLNRAIVHLLDERELESVIGHELGHVFPYSPIASRCLLIHAVLAGVLALVISQLLGDYDVYLGAPILALWAARWVAFGTWTTQIRLVEFLCDGFGAQAAGYVPAISADLKMAMEHEVRTDLMLAVLEAKRRHANLSIQDLLEDYESALPFGGVESEATRQQLEKSLRTRIANANQSSIKGFYQFLFKSGDTDDDALDESIKEIRTVKHVGKLNVPLKEWLSQAGGPSVSNLTLLVKEIEENPRMVLARLQHEIDDRSTTHPNVSRRVLFLWRNRRHYDAVR